MKNEMTVEQLDSAIAVFKELREIAKSKKRWFDCKIIGQAPK